MNVLAPQNTDLSEAALPLTLSAPPAPLWRPGIEDTPQLKVDDVKEEDEEDEEDEEEEEEEEENTGSMTEFKADDVSL